MTDWRYIAQRLPSLDFLHWDLPLTGVELTTVVSAPGGLTASIPVEVASLMGDDGQPILSPWRTAIWAEADGQIRGGGVLTGVTVRGQVLRLECTGIGGAAVVGQPWTAGTRRLFETDPLDIVRMVYAHVQGQPGGDLGIVVDTTTTPVKVGIPEDPTRRATRLRADAMADRLDAAKTTLDKAKRLDADTRKAALRAAGLKDMSGKLVVQDGEPTKTRTNLWYRPSKNRVHKVGTKAGAKTLEWQSVPAALPTTRTAVAAQTAHENAKTAHDAAKEAADTARRAFTDIKDGEEDPFVIRWSSTHDLGKVLDDLATTTPFDSLEHTTWSGNTLAHRLELTYPRRGRRRDDLRFVIGENVAVPPDAAWGGDYASDVMVLGAGEGTKMVRSIMPTGATGIRRVAVHTDKAIDKQAAADKTARQLSPGMRGGISITSLEVTDHPHAPVGALSPGDEIRLLGRIDWAEIDMWLRVLAITYRPENPSAISLRVAPSLEGVQ